ncbi:alpha-galactosidase [Aestuariibaculum sediminum]|uniref:Alpha-galactosidase n=1 Tax=Aestuariibaculum sediminum TaxID=2770637 RepID=A0A8J6U6U6_9FLAO|nr:alpha-galactosidase [Aestuariibaculum sediminum]MBD0830998.1 alpha-galactosidase [Aestuariibaculum sediminum]
MKNIISSILFLSLFLTGYSQNTGLISKLNSEKEQLKNCYARLGIDTLTIGNAFIERQFLFNNGNLISTKIKNKTTGKTIDIFNGHTPDFNIEGFNPIKQQHTFNINKIDKNPIVPAHIEVQIITVYEGLQVKQLFKIFPSSMGIACDYFLKKTEHNLAFTPEQINIEQLNLNTIHWNAEAIEFIDQTDKNDNYVSKKNSIPYHTNTYVGNLLYLSNLIENKGLYILKEAPVSKIQLNYPGYDFKSKVNDNKLKIQSDGLGLKPSDLEINQWVKAFGYVIGVHNNENLNKKIALRSYQNNLRILQPDRDAMIMVNTWGDRNKDSKLNEAFILNELQKTHELGFTHYQIDDGWQQGLSMNSAFNGERLWNQWTLADWQPNKERFPNGFKKIIKRAKNLGIKIGLWFHPSNENDYKNWEQDANIVLALYIEYGITNFKIDGVKLPTKQADINLSKFFKKILEVSNYQIVFNIDVTADKRYGYHYNNYLGNIFLENRYTDWKNYYPYRTLRNLWMLSEYIPSQRLQIEFLNKWRNNDNYKNDPFGPNNYSFDYLFAITMPSQPLAFFETTGLPEEANASIPLFRTYKSIKSGLDHAYIFPIGNEPSGNSYTGFQFMISDTEGYILVFRERHEKNEFNISTLIPSNSKVRLTKVYGNGKDFEVMANNEGKIVFKLDQINSYCLYKYKVL